MNHREYEIMANLEEKFWWYLGLRGYLSTLFQVFERKIHLKPRVLDVGCGTGANLRFMSEYFVDGEFTGLDMHSISVKYSKMKNPNANILHTDLENPSLPDSQYDIITVIDVLYMTSMKDVACGLETIVSKLKPGGLLILHNPAFNWLYSEHDQAVHTIERSTKRSMVQLATKLGLKPLKVSYRNFLLFPFILIHRIPRILWRKENLADAKSDVVMPHRFLNTFLSLVMAFENSLARSGLNFPFGSSVCLAAQKPL